MPSEALRALHLYYEPGKSLPGLVPIGTSLSSLPLDEAAALREAKDLNSVDYLFFRRFSDGRSSQVAAYIIDNSDERFSSDQLARIHRTLWLSGTAPLLYIGWQTKVDVLSCARKPDFWRHGQYQYSPAATIETAADISTALKQEERRKRFSGYRLSAGTFWDEPRNAELAQSDRSAHRLLIQAVLATDEALEGHRNPLLRRLLLVTVLVKYLEDRQVFPEGWFKRSENGATTFFEVLSSANPESVRTILSKLAHKFNGDVFELPEDGNKLTVKNLRHFADLIDTKLLREQRYLWDQFSFRYIPVEVLSHLYQRFCQRGTGAIYTPPLMATLMLDFALPYSKMTGNERILDPTCGSGIFLVGAFRRLVHFWRSKHRWEAPNVATLKRILRESIHGVELEADAAGLTSFSLTLAICDALKPNVIWRDLRFDKLVGKNLQTGDFFTHVRGFRPTKERPGFSVVIGNPPFVSRLSDAAQKFDRANGQVPVPDKQMAYLIAREVLEILSPNGRMCLIQPSGLLYNERSHDFLRSLIAQNCLEAILDFTSVRSLYDGADTKTVALLFRKRGPPAIHRIQHFTFRRTFSVQERIAFELDHYDRHLVEQSNALDQPRAWRINLLGGGRLHFLASRLQKMRSLKSFVAEQQWRIGEGFIVGTRVKRMQAKWLTGQRFLPTGALTEDGIDNNKIGRVDATRFATSRSPLQFTPPLFLIKEHESLPCAFWDKSFLAYKHKIVGIHAHQSKAGSLRKFSKQFSNNRQLLCAFCLLLGTQALVGKATAILKRDIDALPWPREEANWGLAEWEKLLCKDLTDFAADFVRLGQNSVLLQKRVSPEAMNRFAKIFVEMLGTIYTNLRPYKSVIMDGVACQVFCFGDGNSVNWNGVLEEWLSEIIYVTHGEALRTVRVLRFYDENMMLIAKPDRLRYWIASTAIRDADETLKDLQKQGY